MNLLDIQHPLIKKYVDSIYIFERSEEGMEYTAYPSMNISVGLLKNATLDAQGDSITIKSNTGENYIAIASNSWYRPLHLCYHSMIDEIAINFTPLGFITFTQAAYKKEDYFVFSSWDDELKDLFNKVFSASGMPDRTAIIESFLLAHYKPVPNEAIIESSIKQLSDFDHNHSLEEIAKTPGIHYKELYRLFKKTVGCSPAHYRKVLRFRQSVHLKLSEQGKAAITLRDICYKHNYFDQSSFIKHFQEFTGERPSHFFKVVSGFGRDKIVWKIF